MQPEETVGQGTILSTPKPPNVRQQAADQNPRFESNSKSSFAVLIMQIFSWDYSRVSGPATCNMYNCRMFSFVIHRFLFYNYFPPSIVRSPSLGNRNVFEEYFVRVLPFNVHYSFMSHFSYKYAFPRSSFIHYQPHIIYPQSNCELFRETGHHAPLLLNLW